MVDFSDVETSTGGSVLDEDAKQTMLDPEADQTAFQKQTGAIWNWSHVNIALEKINDR